MFPFITTLPVPFGARLISPLLAVAKLAEPNVAPLIVGVVNVLFVSVSVDIRDTNVELPPVGNVKTSEALAECGCACNVWACALPDSQ